MDTADNLEITRAKITQEEKKKKETKALDTLEVEPTTTFIEQKEQAGEPGTHVTVRRALDHAREAIKGTAAAALASLTSGSEAEQLEREQEDVGGGGGKEEEKEEVIVERELITSTAATPTPEIITKISTEITPVIQAPEPQQQFMPITPTKTLVVRELPPSTSKQPEDQQHQPEWMSKLITILWPYIKSALNKIGSQDLPIELRRNKPSWIHDISLTTFKLGDTPPVVRNVRCFDDENDIMDDTFLEFDLVWDSNQDVGMMIEVLGDNAAAMIPNWIEKVVADLFTVIVGIQNFHIEGTLRVALRPLVYELPVVQGIQVAFLSIPKFDYNPTVEGGPLGIAGSALLPSLRGWLDGIIAENMFRVYTLPEHFFYPIDPNAEDVMLPKGVLHLEVIGARNVPRMDLAFPGLQLPVNPFVEAFVRHTQRHRTAVAEKKVRNPTWNEVFNMPIHEPEYQELVVTLIDFDKFTSNDIIGHFSVPISELPENEMKDMWVNVESEGKEQAEKQKREAKSKTEKVAAGVAAHKKAKMCQLHIKVHYRRWTESETSIIAKGSREGIRNLLKSPQGKQVDRDLRNLLQSGALVVQIKRCEGLEASGILFKPKVKAVVKVGSKIKQTPAISVTRRGNVTFEKEPLELELDGKLTEDTTTPVTIELLKIGWFTTTTLGMLSFRLSEILESPESKIEGRRELDNGHGAVNLLVDWMGYFGD